MRLTAATAARNSVRSNKTYSLIGKMPDSRPTIGRKILAAISKRRGTATTQAIRQTLPRGTSDATLRFYLGKFQREGIVAATEIA